VNQKDKILAISHLYLFPGSVLKRGGLIIHKSLCNLQQTGKEVEVVFFLPFIYPYLKYFTFNWSKFSFEPYVIDGISIYPVFYLPRLSKLSPSLDVKLKTWLFRIFYFKAHRKKDQPLELVYGQTLYPDGPLLPEISSMLKIGFIVNMRGSDVHTFCANNAVLATLCKAVLEKAIRVLAVSEMLRFKALEVFGKDYVDQILYTVCQTDIFKNTRPVNEKVSKFVFIGALVKAKGIFELLEAFSKISKQGKFFQLTLIGGGGNRKAINEFIRDNDIECQIIFKGRISDRQLLVEEINKADVFLFPSHNEGLPNAVVEGLACERAMICSDVGGVKEIAEQNIAFQIVPSKNVPAIIEAVNNLINTDTETINLFARKNRKAVELRFSPDVQIQSFYKIFEESGKEKTKPLLNERS
jgi:glycosyltransferase involved in cell wall biosynthesis